MSAPVEYEADPRDCCPRCGGAKRHQAPCATPDASRSRDGTEPERSSGDLASSVDTDTAAEREFNQCPHEAIRATCPGCKCPCDGCERWREREAERATPADTAAVGDVEALAKVIASRSHDPREPFPHEHDLARRILASDWLRDLLDAARREGGAEALREAADAYERMYQQPGSATGADWLRDRAARLGGAR